MLSRMLIPSDPFGAADDAKNWVGRGVWPANWIVPAGDPAPPFVAAFRVRFGFPERSLVRLHVTADERYELFLDGERVGRGSERGDKENWFFETYEGDLPSGPHVLVARVWALGDRAPFAQMSVRPGFLLAAEGAHGEMLSTGRAKWTAKVLGGFEFLSPGDAWGTGANVRLDGEKMGWDVEAGKGPGWRPAVTGWRAVTDRNNDTPPSQILRPATLPPQFDAAGPAGRVRHVAAAASRETRHAPVRTRDHLAKEAGAWQALAEGRDAVVVPPRTRRRVLIDLEQYCCAYPELVTSGGKGAFVRVLWEEGLYEGAEQPGGWCRARPKGNRDEIEGKYFVGVGDEFLPDGGAKRRFAPLWWQAGRYVELLVETESAPLTIEKFGLRETRYPFEPEGSFECGDPKVTAAIPLMVRALQMCSHETYMDCPYYEQLMYAGDTRLEVLATYMLTRDDRLPRKALRQFDASRLASGFTQSRYPSRIRQVIPPFSLWWIGMVHDFALWRGDRAFVRALMPGVRAVQDAFLGTLNGQGLVEAPNGWNYMDWVPDWKDGCPPDGDRGVSGVINWHFVNILARVGALEAWMGESELAERAFRLAGELGRRATEAFWDERGNLMADDRAKTRFSEHAQCLALLSGQVDLGFREGMAAALRERGDLARATIYFSHYLFRAYNLLGMTDQLWNRLGLWFELPGKGFKTTLEHPEPSRSDCHAWGAHPLFHFMTSVLGVSPAGLGQEEFFIEPKLGPLAWARGTLPLPAGDLTLEVRKDGASLKGRAVLPGSLRATLVHRGETRTLTPGATEFTIG